MVLCNRISKNNWSLLQSVKGIQGFTMFCGLIWRTGLTRIRTKHKTTSQGYTNVTKYQHPPMAEQDFRSKLVTAWVTDKGSVGLILLFIISVDCHAWTILVFLCIL